MRQKMKPPKYKVDDWVVLTKKFIVNVTHIKRIDTEPYLAKILVANETLSFGPSYVIEINGERQKLCYWESDIDSLYDQNNFEDYLWQTWGDK